MSGDDRQQAGMFSFFSPEQRVPQGHLAWRLHQPPAGTVLPTAHTDLPAIAHSR